MKTITIAGERRYRLGKQAAKRLRREANVPCILYGGKDGQVHFYTSVASLKVLIYTPNAHFVNLELGDDSYSCIIQDMQFHPVSEVVLHVDFLRTFENKSITMQVPTKLVGQAPGVIQGGVLSSKLRKLPIHAYPKDMPENIQVDVSSLELGKMVRVGDLTTSNYTILTKHTIPVASVEIPRALRSATGKAEAQEATT